MSPSSPGPNGTTKFWIGMLLTTCGSVASSAAYIQAQVSRLETYVDKRVEDHRVKELHTNHPSKDAFDGLSREIGELRKAQEKMAKTQEEQSAILNRIAEKMGVQK